MMDKETREALKRLVDRARREQLKFAVMNTNCAVCGQIFSARFERQMYCSRLCKSRSNRFRGAKGKKLLARLQAEGKVDSNGTYIEGP